MAKRNSPSAKPPTPPDPPGDSPQAPAEDPSVAAFGEEQTPLEKFLQRAASIIAMERGINSRSRVKLEIVARDLGLPQDEFEAALKDIQRGDKSDAQDEQINAFRMTIVKQLEKLPRAVLTPDLEAKAVKYGVDRYGLTSDQAQKTVKEAAAEKKIQRISQAEAERYMADMIAQKLGGDSWIDINAAERMRNAGRQWGLTEEQVNSLIKNHTENNYQRQQKQRRFTTFAIAAGGIAVVVLLLAIGFTVMLGPKGGAATATGDPDSPGDGPAIPAPKPIVPPDWWSTRLAVAISQTQVKSPDFHLVYQQLADTDPKVRGQGYVALMQYYREHLGDTVLRERISQVVQGCYALDPSPEAIATLRGALLERLLLDRPDPPAAGDDYNMAFRALNTAMGVMQQPLATEERGTALVDELSAKLNVAIAIDDLDAETRKSCYRSLATKLYRQLVDAAPSKGPAIVPLQQSLAKEAARMVDADQLEQFNAQFLTSVLSSDNPPWQKYDSLLSETVQSRDPNVVLQMLEIYERTKDPALQEFLEKKLLTRAAVVPESFERRQVVAAVRKAFGASPAAATATAKDRWDKIRADARTAIIEKGVFSTDPPTLMSATVNAARLGTLAFAVAQQEPGFPIFDELITVEAAAEEPEKKDPAFDPDTTAPRDDRPNVLSASQRKDFNGYISTLAALGVGEYVQRASALRGLAKFAAERKVKDLTPKEARIVAGYLLTPKESESEQKALQPSLRDVRRWRQLRLAFADGVAESRVPDDRLGDMVDTLLNITGEYPAGPAGRKEMRGMLLRNVLHELSLSREPKSGSAAGASAYDTAALEIRDLYRTRARLLGASPAVYEELQTTAEALRLLISLTAPKAGASSAEDRAYIAGLPHQLKAIDYIGGNEIRRTVLLQRAWLRLVSIQAKRQQSTRAREAQEIVDKLSSRDALATNVLHQLKDGETSLLQLWMLYDDR